MSEVSSDLLEVSGLSVTLAERRGPGTTLVEGASFGLAAGSALGLVGESGSGKTMLLKALLGLSPAHVAASGSIRFAGRELVGLPERGWAGIRGSQIALVPQDSMAALNPIRRVERQLTEAIRLHRKVSKRAAYEQSLELLHRVGLPDARQVTRCYPHQLSGGMRQRVVIAMALSCNPRLVLCDEPTTALDVTVQAQVLRLLRSMCDDLAAALIFVSHDLAVVRQLCQRVAVMYAGRLVETGPVAKVFAEPRHGYTASLLRSLPDVDQPSAPWTIPGEPPSPRRQPSGCRFHPRCPYAVSECTTLAHQLTGVGPDWASACLHGAAGLPALSGQRTTEGLATP